MAALVITIAGIACLVLFLRQQPKHGRVIVGVGCAALALWCAYMLYSGDEATQGLQRPVENGQ